MYAYQYKKDTKEAIKNLDGTYKKIPLQVDQLNGGYLPHPKGTLPIEPPEVSENHAAIANETIGVWDIVSDYRGSWFNKITKEKKVITSFGLFEDVKNYTRKEPVMYSKWDESTQEWVFDIEEYKNKVISDVNMYSFSVKDALFPNHKFMNLLSGIQYTTPYTLDTHKKLVDYCRDIVHSFEDAVQGKQTKDGVDELYEKYMGIFPTNIDMV